MYSIVEFKDSQDVAVVASSWLESDKSELFCYWPSKCANVTKAARSNEAPNRNSWTRYLCRKLYETGQVLHLLLYIMNQVCSNFYFCESVQLCNFFVDI
jgi:hypothetical protein